MRAFVAVVRIILFTWWLWAELKPKYYIVNNLKANEKCKLWRELLNCMMALYPLMNELAYQTIMLSVWFKQSSLTLWSAQYNGTKQIIGTNKNGNWNASTVLICFPFFNQGSLISATAMYIALRLISLSSLLLFVLFVFFHTVLSGTDWLCPAFLNLEQVLPLCTFLVLEWWSRAQSSGFIGQFCPPRPAVTVDPLIVMLTHRAPVRIMPFYPSITEVCPCAVCPVPLKMGLNTSEHDRLIALSNVFNAEGKVGTFTLNLEPSH